MSPEEIASNPASAQPASRLQLTVVMALLIGYATLSYYSNAAPDAKNLGAGLTVGPVFLIGLVLVWRWTRPLVAIPVIAALCGALYYYWPVLKENYEWADLAQQAAIYGFLALSFWRSLMPGRTPLCTQLADKLHGPLGPAEIAYTRHATVAWGMFYLLLTALILILFFVAPLRVWSLFVNFATYGLIALMFVADYSVRRRVLPHAPGSGILAALQQFLTGGS